MRRVIFSAACSLDGRIAGPGGEIDWIRMDADYGMAAFMASVDAVLIGRKTFEFAREQGMRFDAKMRNYVLSTTMRAGKQGEVEVVGSGASDFVQRLKAENGKDIWLMGGRMLFDSLFEDGLVDEVMLAVHPVVLGGGPRLFCGTGSLRKMELAASNSFANGVVQMKYRVGG